MSKRANILLPKKEPKVWIERLKAGYLANADENLQIAAEWFPMEEQAWHKSGAARVQKQKIGRSLQLAGL